MSNAIKYHRQWQVDRNAFSTMVSFSIVLNSRMDWGTNFLNTYYHRIDWLQIVLLCVFQFRQFPTCVCVPLCTGSITWHNIQGLLTVPRRYFFCGSFLCYLCLVFVMLSRLFNAVLWSSAGKGLTSCLWCLIVFCHFPMWYPRSGVVLDCIESWSLVPFFLWAHHRRVCHRFTYSATNSNAAFPDAKHDVGLLHYPVNMRFSIQDTCIW